MGGLQRLCSPDQDSVLRALSRPPFFLKPTDGQGQDDLRSGLRLGPDVDPALLDIQEALLKIKAKWPDTVQVERYTLSQQPGKFAENPSVLKLLELHGTSAFPATVINGEIRQYGDYPSYDDLDDIIARIQGGAANANG
ncbi:MAG: arsenic metallochaperone ArsD family protein [candidate division WOR-3 bacterium]